MSHKIYNGPIKVDLADRFWSKVKQSDDPDECWEWLGSVDKFGYGRLTAGGRGSSSKKAHRVSWELHFGEIPAGKCVLHNCDNPPCTNPNHLRVGTKRENSQEMRSKGRSRGPNGKLNPPRGPLKKYSLQGMGKNQAVLTDNDVRAIRDLWKDETISQQAIADQFGVSRSLISGIVNGKRWAHLL